MKQEFLISEFCILRLLYTCIFKAFKKVINNTFKIIMKIGIIFIINKKDIFE